jgi:hypothetical protein
LYYSVHIVILAILLTIFSCERVKRKGHAVVDKTKQAASVTKQKISNKVDNLVDKVFPKYENGKADTEDNKKRFDEYLQVELTADIKNIYAYGDFFGADYKVLIAFNCDPTTVEKIIAVKKMQLTKSKDDNGLLFLDEFKWWDKSKIELLEPYKVGEQSAYWQYLWYDPKTKQAYYEEYSL